MLISHGQKRRPFIFLCRSWELKRLGERICGFVCYTQKLLRHASLILISKDGLLENKKKEIIVKWERKLKIIWLLSDRIPFHVIVWLSCWLTLVKCDTFGNVKQICWDSCMCCCLPKTFIFGNCSVCSMRRLTFQTKQLYCDKLNLNVYVSSEIATIVFHDVILWWCKIAYLVSNVAVTI